MNKLDKKTYKGIDYIQVEEVQLELRDFIIDWISSERIISIMINGAIVHNCIQYSEYEFWFDNILPKQLVTKQQKIPAGSKNIKVAFSKQ